TGLFVDSFTKLLTAINGSENKDEETNITYAADAHNYLGYYAYLQGNSEEAKQHFTETLSLKPDDPFAQQMAEAL
ncbi:MAG: tetratricopeptide repeat protein, partial [Sphingobacterium sp.]